MKNVELNILWFYRQVAVILACVCNLLEENKIKKLLLNGCSETFETVSKKLIFESTFALQLLHNEMLAGRRPDYDVIIRPFESLVGDVGFSIST